MPEPRPVPRIFPQCEAGQQDADGGQQQQQQPQQLIYDEGSWTSEWRCTQPGGSNVFMVEMSLAGAVGPVK
jgi:hypothetical protein